jgi:serpin B
MNRKTILSLALIFLASILLVVSCGTSTRAVEGEFSYSDVERDLSPNVTPAEIDELVADNRHFAFDLYNWLIQSNDNLIYSPWSISVALSMAYAGAEGQPKTDMAGVLHFNLDDETLHAAFDAIDLELDEIASVEPGYGEEEAVPFTLNTANSLWVQEDLELNPDFLDILSLDYGAGVGRVDFQTDPVRSAEVVNDWIADKTEDKITDALSPESLSENTILLIINAIYFLANWENQFKPDVTEDDVFHTFADGDVTVPMMSQQEHFRYSEGDGWQAVELPYIGRGASMLILLPESEEYTRVEGMLDQSFLAEIKDGMEYEDVRLTMPKFEFRSHLNLGDTLREMGMESAFEYGFDSMLAVPPPNPVAIDEVIHEAFISVDEEGTEAAAVTIVEMDVTSAPMQEPVEFTVDHPFIFLITESSTDTILFMGRVMNPA